MYNNIRYCIGVYTNNSAVRHHLMYCLAAQDTIMFACPYIRAKSKAGSFTLKVVSYYKEINLIVLRILVLSFCIKNVDCLQIPMQYDRARFYGHSIL